MGFVSSLDEAAAVRRLVDRFGFGARPGELASAVAGGFAATVTSAVTGLQRPPVDPGVAATPEPNLGAEPDLTATKATPARQQTQRQLTAQENTLTVWWLDRMVAANAPLVERLTWFWHGHFATSEQKVRSAILMQRQNNTFRQLGNGAFPALAQAVMVDPAMLLWLDGEQNKVGAPNENLGRESMELFLLGIGHYTETDVREAARALTGWTVDRTTGDVRFLPKRHDNGSKTILGQTGNFDVTSFTDLVLSQPNSPRHIVGRLWYRLVSSTSPADDVIDRLVAAYGPNGDIPATLTAITAEPDFVDSASVVVKEPVEWAVGLLRALNVRPSQLPAARLLDGLRGMGQLPFLPPNVGGWPADGAWLTTAAALARFRLAQLVAAHADLSTITNTSSANRAEAVRQLLNVDAWSPRTLAALADAQGDPRQLTAVAACAPEYVVSL